MPQDSVALGKFPTRGAKHMASVREAVEKVLLDLEVGDDSQRHAAWTVGKARMEDAFAAGASVIAGCEIL